MSTAASSNRQPWADVAKGACIVLVVLWHVTRKDYLQLPWSIGVPVTGAWGALSESLLPVRMPLFFAVSGLFAARQLTRPWGEVWSRRIGPLVYLFVLWTLVHNLVLRLARDFDTATAGSPRELLVQLTVTPGNLWYLAALAAYVAVARATHRVPRWTMFGAAILSTLAYAGMVPTPGNRAGLLTNLVWFLLGTRVARGTPVGYVGWIVPVLGYVSAAAAWQVLDADNWLGVRPILGILGIGAGAAVATRLVLVPRLGKTLAALGGQTLPIYVLHLPLVALVHVVSARLIGSSDTVAHSLVLAAIYPALLTILVLGVCLGLHRLLLGCRGWWLFEAPWLRRTHPAKVRSATSPDGGSRA